jgi:predicted TIM-barrel fold metal-dependent hydrolase
MAIGVHIANGSPAVMSRFQPRYDKSGGFAPFRIPTVVSCLSLMMSEVPKVFPTLRWGFIESSAQWIPWIVNEARSRSGSGGFPDDPLSTFKVYVTAQTDDDFPYVLKYAGEESLMMGTDYGHFDSSSEVDAFTKFRANESIGEEAKQKILSDNPSKLYAIQ